MISPESAELLTVDEFARIAKMHPQTVRRAILKGHINGFRLGSGKRSSYRIAVSEIERIAVKDYIDRLEN